MLVGFKDAPVNDGVSVKIWPTAKWKEEKCKVKSKKQKKLFTCPFARATESQIVESIKQKCPNIIMYVFVERFPQTLS
jgi:ADP-heptose:LPS heptosyltransferase